MDGIFLLLGSNLGNRVSYIEQAKKHIQTSAGDIIESSSIYETAPWGNKKQPSFLNEVLHIDSSWPPDALLSLLLDIEEELGRVRTVKWGERCIDIDILYYNDLITESESLTLPHPGIPVRRFTLIPLVEIAPDFIHPILLSSQKTLLSECRDALEVCLYST